MRVVIQRVKHASVRVEDKTVGKIGYGLLLLIGISRDDEPDDIDFVAEKCVHLRIFNDHDGKMNQSVLDVGGGILAVSQFTLLANTKKGRRPSYIDAALPEKANNFYLQFIEKLKSYPVQVETGEFGAMMEVELLNDGPVTLIVEGKEKTKE